MKFVFENIGKIMIALFIFISISTTIFVKMVTSEMNKYTSAKELCIKKHNTDDYRLLNGNTYCKVDDEFIEAKKTNQSF